MAYMAQTGGTPTKSAFVYSLPLGLLALAVVHANNMRDCETDSNAHKHTITNTLKLVLSRVLYLLIIAGAYGIIAALGIPHHAPHFILLVFWTLPLLVVVVSGIIRTKAPAGFHMVMRETLRIETVFVLLMISGICLSTLIPVLSQIPQHLLPF